MPVNVGMVSNKSAERSSLLSKRNIVAAAFGNTLEWYDFAVFGYLASIIGKHFFPSDDPLSSLIKAFGVYAAGYLVRPIGGFVFGHVGDRFGRKRALFISILMMAIFTTLVGCMPTYQQIGVAAPILLVILRLAQGLSVGGEFSGSISFLGEIAPPERRGFFSSWALFSSSVGFLLGSMAATIVHHFADTVAVEAWGWRVPFLFGFIVGGFGLWIRRELPETPEFHKLEETGEIEQSPVFGTFRRLPGPLIRVSGLVMLVNISPVLFTWMPTYLTHIVKPPVQHAFGINTIALAVTMAFIPVSGWLTDRIGRRMVLAAAALALLLSAYPLFQLLDRGTMMAALRAQLTFAVLMGFVWGTLPVAMVEMFPTALRYTAVGAGYNICHAVLGGTAPLVCTWLIAQTDNIVSPAYYMMLLTTLGLLAALSIRSKAGTELD